MSDAEQSPSGLTDHCPDERTEWEREFEEDQSESVRWQDGVPTYE